MDYIKSRRGMISNGKAERINLRAKIYVVLKNSETLKTEIKKTFDVDDVSGLDFNIDTYKHTAREPRNTTKFIPFTEMHENLSFWKVAITPS